MAAGKSEMTKVLCLAFLLLLNAQAFGCSEKGTVYYVVTFSCMEIGGTEYHGSPGDGRYNSDARIAYEFDDPIALSSVGGQPDFTKVKKAIVTYWKNDGWHTKNLLGVIKQGIRKSPKIKEEES